MNYLFLNKTKANKRQKIRTRIKNNNQIADMTKYLPVVT